jgi:septal ring factor EnvC (AmiA/AmiB activator)
MELVNRYACGLLGFGLLLSALASAQDPAELENELEQLRDEITSIQERLAGRFEQRDEARQALEQVDRNLAAASTRQRQTAEQVEQVQNEITSLENDIHDTESAAARISTQLSDQLKLVYKQGMPSRLQMLLNQQDPRRLRRNLAYHGHLSRQRLSLIEELTTLQESMQRNQQTLEAQMEQLARLSARNREELAAVTRERERRDRVLQEINAQITADSDRVAKLERDAEALAALIDELEQALDDIAMEADVPSILELAGTLPPPVEGTLTTSFGEPRGGQLSWTGWLLSAPVGAEVQPIAHGRVAYADWLRGYGMLMIIDHGDGIMSLYGHNESLLRSVGNWVGPGDVIATVGQSGGGGVEGLYFEIRRDGKPVDPARWVKRR